METESDSTGITISNVRTMEAEETDISDQAVITMETDDVVTSEEQVIVMNAGSLEDNFTEVQYTEGEVTTADQQTVVIETGDSGETGTAVLNQMHVVEGVHDYQNVVVTMGTEGEAIQTVGEVQNIPASDLGTEVVYTTQDENGQYYIQTTGAEGQEMQVMLYCQVLYIGRV